MGKDSNQLSFLEHLEELRGTILRSLVAVTICAIATFCFKATIFDGIILAPSNSDFFTYRLLFWLSEWLNMPQIRLDTFSISLTNINLTGQFLMHMKAAFWCGIILAFPYVFYEIWRFLRPALYANERKSATEIFVFGGLLFVIGIAVSYFLIFPLTLRFLGTYEVSSAVANQITLQSYMSTFTVLTLCLGILFELPMVIYFLSKMGLVTKDFLQQKRRWAIILIMILAAIITPTTDPFTLLIVTLPLYLLYETSILICKK